MSDAIVSHVASPEYRDGIESMRCAVPGCKRWRVDEACDRCEDHRTISVTRDRAKDCNVFKVKP